MLLRSFASQTRWGNGAVCLAITLFAGSCKISQPSNDAPDACAIGDLCGDGGTSEALSTMGVAPTSVTSQTSRSDASTPPAGICPGECLPDDRAPKECAAPVIIDLQFANQEVLDGGLSSLDLDASVASSDAAPDASLTNTSSGGSDAAISDAAVDLVDGLDGATNQATGTQTSDTLSRPLDVVDKTSEDTDGNAKTPLSCQLVSLRGSVTAGCAPSGLGVEGSVCTSATDCAPGFGCVGEQGAGQCLPYCCSGDDVCGANRYCDLRPMRSLEFASAEQAPKVPVCVVAEQCTLDLATEGEQPDARGAEANSCPENSACTLVRANTTACRPTGKGKEGQDCPCGAGYFCSRVSNTCLKLCNTNEPASCGQRECQPGPSGFPDGWGLCVGG